MATKSIFTSVQFKTKQDVDNFVKALEESEAKTSKMPSKKVEFETVKSSQICHFLGIQRNEL